MKKVIPTTFITLVALLMSSVSCNSQSVDYQNKTLSDAEMAGYEVATLAGGCFWCMQPPFDKREGVIQTTVGYTGGKEAAPTYQEVSSGSTGHTEAVEVIFDPKQISYKEILDIFWMNINPTTADRQFADVGSQYRPEIFYHSKEQQSIAQESKEALGESGHFNDPIVVPITESSSFYPAEDYHQKYYLKNTMHYKAYHVGSGRAGYLKKIWK